MSHQTIKPFERNITIGAVILGLVTFPFILGPCQSTISSFTPEPIDSAIEAEPQLPTQPGSADEIAILQAELEQAYGHIDVAQAELTDARNSSYTLQLKTNQLTAEIKRLKAEQGLKLAHSNSIEDVPAVDEAIITAPPLTPDPQIAILTAQLATLQSKAATNKSTLDAQLKAAQKRVNDTHSQNEALQLKITKLNQLISKDDLVQREKQIHETINALRTENTQLRRSENKMKQDALSVETQWEKKLEQAGDPYKSEIDDLKGKLAILRSQSVFAISPEDLDAQSAALFKRLQGLEEQSPTELAESYKSIKAEFKANDITRLKFGTGRVSLDQQGKNKIEAALKDIQPKDRFLIIGYASNQGNEKLNERLSSNRAKAMADKVLREIGSENIAKAVYLGETNRFGKTRENQCVELWKISP